MPHKILIKVGILVEYKGKLLLIKEKRWLDGAYRWNIIKGSFDPKQDRDFLGTALRETKEEANASIRIKNLLSIIYLQKDNQTFIQFNYTASLLDSHFAVSDTRQQKKYRSDEDIVDVRLFSKKELKVMKKSELVGTRTYVSIQAWLKGKSSPLDAIQIVHDY
jgi:8-oxo-dGTP pyrophosphatase MutT (NUDIX family)